MYSNPERWNTIQKAGYLVDNKKQLIGGICGGASQGLIVAPTQRLKTLVRKY